MNEIFKQIIIGKQPITALSANKFSGGPSSVRWSEISISFLTAAKIKYAMGELRLVQIDDLLNKYIVFLEGDPSIQAYIQNSSLVSVELEQINRDIVFFIDDYLEKVNMVENNKSK